MNHHDTNVISITKTNKAKTVGEPSSEENTDDKLQSKIINEMIKIHNQKNKTQKIINIPNNDYEPELLNSPQNISPGKFTTTSNLRTDHELNDSSDIKIRHKLKLINKVAEGKCNSIGKNNTHDNLLYTGISSLPNENINEQGNYNYIVSPLQKNQWLRCEIDVEKTKNGVLYYAYMSDYGALERKPYMYAISNALNTYFIGTGELNYNLGKNSISLFTKNKEKVKIENNFNEKYIAKLSINLLRTQLLLYLKYRENCFHKTESDGDIKIDVPGNSDNLNIDFSNPEKDEKKMINICAINYDANVFKYGAPINIKVIIPNQKEPFDYYKDIDSLLKEKKSNLQTLCKNDLLNTINNCIILSNKVPDYDPVKKKHIMNYINRNVINCSKNFQLIEMTGGTIYFQFGKIQDNRYIFDFKAPLSPLQAFSIALGTLIK